MVVGIDEVGRGPWAGPMTMCAVGLSQSVKLPGLADSKVLSPKTRQRLALLIKQQAGFITLVWVAPATIDQLGLSRSLRLATRQILKRLPADAADIILDGNINYAPESRIRTMVKADTLVPAVSAASIVAKVARDNYMKVMSGKLNLYGFEHHKGYGTLKHRQRLELHGACDLHRYSFKPVSETAL